ncbi:MAG: major capsid protein [Lautropia sp.]|nr:major capsid protein [Lautropia sp.]
MIRKMALAASVGMLGAPAFAAVPEGVTNAITTAQTDATTVAAAVLVAIVALFGFRLMRRALA